MLKPIHLSIHRWTMIVSDETMLNIARVCREYKEYNKKILKLKPDQAKGAKRLSAAHRS